MRRGLLLALIFMVSACGSPPVSTPAPTPQAINLIYPPSLQPWADRLADCADANPLVGFYIFPTSKPPGNIAQGQVLLGLTPSEQEIKTAFPYQVGREQIAVIVNQSNPQSKLSTDELRAIFTGEQKTWPENADKPTQVWVLPQGDPFRAAFDQAVLQGGLITSEAMLAPDPTAMLEAISNNTNAIGYLPASYLNARGTIDPGKVNIVQLDKDLQASLSQPVVAITSAEPIGLVRSLLICLETAKP